MVKVARLGTVQKIPLGQPPPMCQRQGCHRRATFLYTEKRTGLRVYRPWCAADRPEHGQRFKNITPRPRVYDRTATPYPADVKCPYCDRKREPREGGHTLRATCRVCRGMTATGERRGRGRPRLHPERPVVVKVPRTARVSPPVAPAAPDFAAFKYHDNGKPAVVKFNVKDVKVLRRLWMEEMGTYPASTHSNLSRKYPTAAIVALWSYWSSTE
jgi:hypothetical protein